MFINQIFGCPEIGVHQLRREGRDAELPQLGPAAVQPVPRRPVHPEEDHSRRPVPAHAALRVGHVLRTISNHETCSRTEGLKNKCC
jgi:hypothetical protein